MGLRLRLKPAERVIINGCVVTNGDRRNTITVSSFGQIMKGKDILQYEDAKTPIQKLYFGIQTMLIDPAVSDNYVEAVNKLGSSAFCVLTRDEDRATLLTAMDWVHRGDFYKALAELRPLCRQQPEDGHQPLDAHASGAELVMAAGAEAFQKRISGDGGDQEVA